MTIGQRIKRYRKIKKMSQVDLAKKINISKQTLYKYENDIIINIPFDKVVELATVLDTTPSEIMGWATTAGDMIKYFRKEKNISISKLSTETGLTVGELYDFEDNEEEPTMDDLNLIANALNIETHKLVFDNDGIPVHGIKVERIFKNNVSSNSISTKEAEMLTLFRNASLELQAAAIAVLKSHKSTATNASENTYKLKIAARNGDTIKEVTITDSDLKKINDLPDLDI